MTLGRRTRRTGPMWRPPSPNLDQASRAVAPGSTNVELQQALEQIRSELALHRTKLGLEAIDNTKHTAAAPVPSLASLAVVGKRTSGVYALVITNPEFANPKLTSSNQQKTPIYHQVTYGTNSLLTDGVDLPPSHQTHYSLPQDPGERLFVTVKSSFDGVRWNQTQTARSA